MGKQYELLAIVIIHIYYYNDAIPSTPYERFSEVYSTSQIIAVLEKREEYMKRRNDPKQREAMIEEYENSEKEKR